jgi:hypothetical protein
LPVTIEVKELRRGGRAILKTRYISIPLWTNRTKEYFIYYIIHELTHFIITKQGHNFVFKAKEQEILKRYDIKIKYSKAYPKFLYHYNTGQIICGKYGEKLEQAYNGIVNLI